MIRLRRNRWRIFRTVLLVVGGIAALVIAATVVWSIFARDTNPVPLAMRSQLTFSPFVIPKDNETYTTSDYRLTKAEDDTLILSYTITGAGSSVEVSQYTQPLQFIDIPEYKDRFLTSVLQQSGTIPTANGTVYVGQLTKQDNQPLGVMLDKGLIVFLRPTEALEETEWRRLGETLSIQKME